MFIIECYLVVFAIVGVSYSQSLHSSNCEVSCMPMCYSSETKKGTGCKPAPDNVFKMD